MKQIIIVVVLLTTWQVAIAQVALRPYNALAKSVQQFYQAPYDMTVDEFVEKVNQRRDSLYQLPLMSLEQMVNFLPSNYINPQGLVAKGRTLPIDYLQFKSDFLSRYGYKIINGKTQRYKVWHYSDVEELGRTFNDYEVAAQILPQLSSVGVYIPIQVQEKLLELLKSSHQYITGESIPGDVLTFSSYQVDGKYKVWATTLVAPVMKANNFTRVWKIPNRQVHISHQGKTYVFAFVRAYKNGVWQGCDNFVGFEVGGEHGVLTNQGRDKGDGESDSKDIKLPENPERRPESITPGTIWDTVRVYKPDGSIDIYLRPHGITGNRYDFYCCPDGQIVRKDTVVVIQPPPPPPVVKPVRPPRNNDEVDRSKKIPKRKSSTVPDSTFPKIPEVVQKPCEPDTVFLKEPSPPLMGFVSLQGEHTWSNDSANENKWRGNIDAGITYLPIRLSDNAYFGASLRIHGDVSESYRGKSWTTWVVPQAKFGFFPNKEIYLGIGAGPFLGTYGIEYDVNATWLPPFPVDVPQKIRVLEGISMTGYGLSGELWYEPINLWGEMRWNKSTSDKEYREGYLMSHVEFGRLFLRAWYWHQYIGSFRSSTRQYNFPNNLGEEWSAQIGVGLTGVSDEDILDQAMSLRHGEKGRSFTTNPVILYTGLIKRFFTSPDYFSNKLGLSLGLMLRDWPAARLSLDLRYTFFPRQALGSDWFHNYEVVQSFPVDPATNLHYTKLRGWNFFHDEHSLLLQIDFSF